jgi:hypothetical protein
MCQTYLLNNLKSSHYEQIQVFHKAFWAHFDPLY